MIGLEITTYDVGSILGHPWSVPEGLRRSWLYAYHLLDSFEASEFPPERVEGKIGRVRRVWVLEGRSYRLERIDGSRIGARALGGG